jgi:hypothetical protein
MNVGDIIEWNSINGVSTGRITAINEETGLAVAVLSNGRRMLVPLQNARKIG